MVETPYKGHTKFEDKGTQSERSGDLTTTPNMSLLDIPFLNHSKQYGVGLPFAAVLPSAFQGRLCTGFWRVSIYEVKYGCSMRRPGLRLGTSPVPPHQTGETKSLWSWLCTQRTEK